MKIGSYTVSLETLIHSEFQRSMLYGLELEPDEKFVFRKILAYLVSKSIITLSAIKLHDLQLALLVATKISFR